MNYGGLANHATVLHADSLDLTTQYENWIVDIHALFTRVLQVMPDPPAVVPVPEGPSPSFRGPLPLPLALPLPSMSSKTAKPGDVFVLDFRVFLGALPSSSRERLPKGDGGTRENDGCLMPLGWWRWCRRWLGDKSGLNW